jgi:hypothetical protein
MREIRKSGSEGGVRFNPSFLPLSVPAIDGEQKNGRRMNDARVVRGSGDRPDHHRRVVAVDHG